MEFASRTIPHVADISRYVSEDLVSSVSPRIFPGRNAVGARASHVVVVRALLGRTRAVARRWLGSWDGGPAQSDPGVLARGPVRLSAGAGRRDGRLAARRRLARARVPLGPAVPDALAGPLLWRDDRNGPSGRPARPD